MKLNFDNLPLYYLSFNDKGIIYTLNRTLAEAIGYDISELEGQKIELIFPVSTRIFYQTHFFPLLKLQGHAEEIFIFLLSKNGEDIPVLMNAWKQLVGDEAVYSFAGILVSNRKKFEEELIAAKKQAETALRENSELIKTRELLSAQAKELDQHIQIIEKQVWEFKQFNKIATHDLEEPLRKIQTWANKYIEQNPDETDPALLKLFSEIKNMQSTISGLQQFVWLGESQPELDSLLLEQVILASKQQVTDEMDEAKISFSISGSAKLKADPRQLLLLFYHLFKNAVQFKKEGEPVRVNISIRQIRKNEFRALQDHYEYGDHIQIIFSDQGIGFDPAFNQQVFEPFRKLNHGDQQGLGLSLCKLIVENHKGTIEASGELGEGSTVTILLPLDQR